jgi:predicted nucleotidyltransferase
VGGMFDLDSFRAEADSVLAALAPWARTREDVESIILVGSYARGAERVDSHIDVVLLVSDMKIGDLSARRKAVPLLGVYAAC